jgi:response regulator NasT
MTSSKLRILLVTDTDKPIGELREALARLGYEMLVEAAHPQALTKVVQRERPDVVIIDTESPSRDTLEQLAVMNAAAPRPVVMFSPSTDQQLIRSAVGAGVTAYMVEGLAPDRLAPIIEVALARFAEESRLRQKLAEVELQLSERKLIDRAKGILIDKRHMSEAAAYETMRSQAMRSGIKIAEVARRIIEMADLLG